MAMATRVPAVEQQLLKLEEDGKMVIISSNLDKEMVRTIELMLSSSAENGLETMVAVTPSQTVLASPTRTGHGSNGAEIRMKSRAKSVFPRRRKSVKRMIYESTSRYILSLFDLVSEKLH